MGPLDILFVVFLAVLSMALVYPPGQHSSGQRRRSPPRAADDDDDDGGVFYRDPPVEAFLYYADLAYRLLIIFVSGFIGVACVAVGMTASTEEEAEKSATTYLAVSFAVASLMTIASAYTRAELIIMGLLAMYVAHALAGVLAHPASALFIAAIIATTSLYTVVMACLVLLLVKNLVSSILSRVVDAMLLVAAFAFDATSLTAGGVAAATTGTSTSPYSLSLGSYGLWVYIGSGTTIAVVSWVVRREILRVAQKRAAVVRNARKAVAPGSGPQGAS